MVRDHEVLAVPWGVGRDRGVPMLSVPIPLQRLGVGASNARYENLRLSPLYLAGPRGMSFRAIYDEQPWIHMILVPREAIREAIPA